MRLRTLSFWLASGLAVADAESHAHGNFSLSCHGIDLVSTVFLIASCRAPGQGTAETLWRNKLDLNLCIGLDQASGRLQWDIYGKFSNYCRNCTVAAARGDSDHLLTCSCIPLIGRQGPIQSSLNLDEGIGNDKGVLECAGGIATLTNGTGRSPA
ncbi:hypothetical protein VTK56DRAFT_9719 [Thermocarpiscus australiensis]